jgi:uncharacterized protein (TIGR02569 family)
MARIGVDQSVLDAFRCTQVAIPLPGGEGRTYRSGHTILRWESNPLEANYLAEVFDKIRPSGFRVSRPIPNTDGKWIADDGWSAWTFLEGSPAHEEDLPSLIPAIERFHTALLSVERPAYLTQRSTLFDHADKAAWNGDCEVSSVRISRLIHDLNFLREPVNFPEQLIHGDLNPGNFLITPNEPPAIIDMAPYWRPAAFATAITAYWFGPYQGKRHVLQAFPAGKLFAQLILRAAIRSLVIHARVSDDPDHGDDFARYARATELVCDYVLSHGRSEKVM